MSEFLVNDFIGFEPTVTLSGAAGWAAVAVWLLAVFVLTLRRAPWGFGLLLCVTPLYQFRGSIGLPTTLLELTLGAVLLGWLVQYRRYPLRMNHTWPWLVGVTVGSLAAAAVSPDMREGFGLWRAFFLEPIAFILAATAVFRAERLVPLFYGLIGSLGVIGTWTMVRVLNSTELAYDGRLLGPYQSANFLALAVVPVILAALLWPAKELPRPRLARLGLRLAPAMLGGGLLLASGSRGGYLSLAAGLGVVVLYRLREFTRLQLIVMAGVVLIAVASTAPALFSRERPILPIRQLLLEQSIEFIGHRPIFGVGPGQFQSRVAEKYIGNAEYERYFVPFAPNSHNLLLVLWVEWGLATLVAAIGLLVVVVQRSLRLERPWKVMMLALLTATLVHGVVDTAVLKNDLVLIFSVMVVTGLTAPLATRIRKGTR